MSKQISRDLYPEKIKWLTENYTEVSPEDFYRIIFPCGSFQKTNESNGDYKSNGLLLFRRKEEKEDTMHSTIIFDEHSEINDCVENNGFFENCEFAIISGCSYIGRRKLNFNARKCCAIIIDIDQVDELRLSMLLGMASDGILPKPTAVVVSGNGIHVYYVLDKPIKLYKNQYASLSDLKQLLSRKLWNANTSLDSNPQYQGITQGYRVVGTKTKRGHITRAFLTGEKVTIDYLISGVYDLKEVPYLMPKKTSHNRKKDTFAKRTKEYIKNNELYDELYSSLVDDTSINYTLEEAKKLFPEWYQRRIINNEQPGHYIVNEAVYNTFFKAISTPGNVQVGHRWYCMYCLAAFAQKCNIPESRFINDLGKLFPIYQSLSDKKENKFTVDDVKAVIKVFRHNDLIHITKRRISALSGINFKETVRTKPKRKQKEHLQDCRKIRDAKYVDGNHWYDNGGRPSKDEVISEYLKSHPNITNISQIARGCGVSRPTVYKYFKAQNIENLATNTDVPNDNINYLEHGNIDSVIPDDEDYLPY